MDNQIKQTTQYAKLSALYKAIILLQTEVQKEQEILNKLKAREEKSNGTR